MGCCYSGKFQAAEPKEEREEIKATASQPELDIALKTGKFMKELRGPFEHYYCKLSQIANQVSA